MSDKAAEETKTKPTTEAAPKGEKKTRRKRPKRPVWYECLAIRKQKGEPTLVQEKIVFDVEAGEEPNEEEARSRFKTSTGMNAIHVIGPAYDVENLKNKTVNKDHVNLPIDMLKMTGKQWKSVYNGIETMANGIAACEFNGEKFDDNDLCVVNFGKKIDKDAKRPRFGGATAVLRFESLQNREEL